LLQRQLKQPDREQPGLDYLLGHTLGQRVIAQTELVAAGQCNGHDFDDFLRDLVVAVCPPPDGSADATFVVLARPLLSNLLHSLEEKVTGDLTDYPHLHEVRIAGKRLRYAMEVFATCFCPAFRQAMYPMVEEMQEILGLANDSYVAAGRLRDQRTYLRSSWPEPWKRLGPGIDAALQFHQKRLPIERRRFVRWWKRWQTECAVQMQECLEAAAVV
jgi:hypothetical protein